MNLLSLPSLLTALAAALALLSVWALWRVRRMSHSLEAQRRRGDSADRGLDDGLRRERARRAEVEALLSSMSEGVLAVAPDTTLLRVNDAALELLQADRGATPRQPGPIRAAVTWHGRPLVELVRSPRLARMVDHTLADGQTRRERLEIVRPVAAADQAAPSPGPNLPTRASRHVEVHVAELTDGDGHRDGVVIVLHDVTRLQRLEVVRQDFVANVSHEVRTPVASIRAAVETLLEGCGPDASEAASTSDASPDATDTSRSASPLSPEQTTRLLRVIDRQAERLDTIVRDLLTLARLDRQREAAADASPVAAGELLDAAAATAAVHADSRGVVLRVEADRAWGLHVVAHAHAIEQALINLIDNAVAYGPEGGTVRIWAEPAGERLVHLHVQDQGHGIAAEHLSRIFERFYRVDAARSRRAGGTGLGLAIVKHIAELHGGSVQVRSRLGRGSTFTITLPRAP